MTFAIFTELFTVTKVWSFVALRLTAICFELKNLFELNREKHKADLDGCVVLMFVNVTQVFKALFS